MARPIGDAYGFREPTIDDLREAYIGRAYAKNLAPRARADQSVPRLHRSIEAATSRLDAERE